MRTYSGLVINPGIAYAKALKIKSFQGTDSSVIPGIDQTQVLKDALLASTKRLEDQIASTHMRYSDRISVIFEAHKLMANDPMILNRALELIGQGKSAYDAYKTAVHEVVEIFKKLDNDYMRNRIVDIEDATDRVLSVIADVEYEQQFRFTDKRILIMEKMKPSILINCDKDMVAGFLSEQGSYNQHSGTIARTKDIPGLIIPGVLQNIEDDEMLLVDGTEGKVYVGPTPDFVNQLLEERR